VTIAEAPAVLRAPFPWFGGKSRAAHLVWPRFGDVHNYVEPFAGSLAVLLNRPHAPKVETVNDLDCYLANFWRALQADPEAVAYYADQPVNEADLHGRHRWLVERGRRRVLRCMRDPHYFDPKIAGWWVYGQCLWIGSGWCATTDKRNQHPSEQRKKARAGDVGINTLWNQKPYLKSEGGVASNRRWQGGGERGGGSGVHAVGLTRQHQKLPSLGGEGGGMGIHKPTLTRQMPRISAEGGSISGVTASTYELGEGEDLMPQTVGLYAYLHQLAARLRRVRVCCGDWGRVLTPSVTTYIGVTAVFLDPPYGHELRERCYSEDHDISADVRAWALAHGDDRKFRIALCGYEGEHAMPDTWTCVPWKAHGGYSRSERGVANRERERIWFSPHCLPDVPPLFAERADDPCAHGDHPDTTLGPEQDLGGCVNQDEICLRCGRVVTTLSARKDLRAEATS
jgi:hypothetical protein